MNNIKFGTDGWRAIIGKEYTFDNLSIVTQATARWIADEDITRNGVIIGYDCRFNGKLFAEHVASVFAAMDIPVRMANSIVPTPAVSWGSMNYDAVGIVITASHNPPEYNGFKIKAPFGGPATPDQIGAVEQQFTNFDSDLEVIDYQANLKTGKIREIDLAAGYRKMISDSINLGAIRNSGITIGHDPMYGSGRTIIKKIIGNGVKELHGELNPGFHGIPPEPIEKNLSEFSAFVKENNCDIGIANDGDADRIGLFDENGSFVDSHKILSLLTKYLSQKKGLSGTIIKTFSTTNMLNKQAELYGLPIETTPIGFKYIAEKIVEKDVMVGGEESGGIAVKGHIPERDGIYIGLLIAEMMVEEKKTLSELVKELNDEFGPHFYYRDDLHTEEKKKWAMMDFCKAKKLTSVDGHKVIDWEFTDGVKHILENGAWLLVRPSGTEPVLRVYCEAPDADTAKSIVKDASAWVERPEILD